MPKVVAKPEVCMGCHLCEVWCVVAHSNSKDIVKAFKYEKTPHPRIIVDENLPEVFAIQCRHCEEPDCVFACISGALYKDESGRVVHDESKCVGCLSCVMACPHGGIVIDLDNRKIVKCDLCEEIGFPVCVKMCPNEALIYEEG